MSHHTNFFQALGIIQIPHIFVKKIGSSNLQNDIFCVTYLQNDMFLNNSSFEYGVTTLLDQITTKGARADSGFGTLHKSLGHLVARVLCDSLREQMQFFRNSRRYSRYKTRVCVCVTLDFKWWQFKCTDSKAESIPYRNLGFIDAVTRNTQSPNYFRCQQNTVVNL